MSYLDSEQVRLRLTSIPFILNELRKKRRLVMLNGVETFQVQFDSRTFNFVPGSTIVVGRSVADCLRSDARVIVGNPLDGPVEEILEVVGTFDLSRGESASPTQCPACHEEQGNTQKLVAHLLEFHDDSPKPTAKPAGRPKKSEMQTPDESADGAE